MHAEVTATFRRAEEAGLRLAIRGRLVALALIGLWLVGSRPWPKSLALLAVLLLLAALGAVQYRLIGSRFDRWWHKYAFITVDAAVLVAAIAFAPLSLGGDVPQILAFRNDAFHYLFALLAVAAFGFVPWLVVWAGLVAALFWWAAFAWIVAGMARTVTWTDMPPAPDAAAYLAVFLDPDFIGVGSRVQETVVLLAVAVVLALAVRRARGVVWAQARAERERELVTRTFGRYVPPAVAAELVRDGGTLAPRHAEASVLFADIESFTAFAERTPPARVVATLNAFFDVAEREIVAAGGTVIQFLGDGLLASFNVPLANPDHAAAAVRAGRCLLALSEARTFADERLAVRVGVASGPLLAGTVGGGGRRAYTVYGDTVNLAARLEALNKRYGTRLLVAAATAARAGDGFVWRDVGTAAVRGKSQPVRLLTTGP